MPQKVFTLEEANSSIPSLMGIFDKMAAIRLKANLVREALDTPSRGRPEEQENPAKLMEKLNSATEDARKLVEQVKVMGCIPKDLENGLIDFPSLLEGKQIFLCWKYGEDKISYWHDTEGGYRGRQPLSEISEEVRRF